MSSSLRIVARDHVDLPDQYQYEAQLEEPEDYVADRNGW